MLMDLCASFCETGMHAQVKAAQINLGCTVQTCARNRFILRLGGCELDRPTKHSDSYTPDISS